MNMVEAVKLAIKTGRRYKRKHWNDWGSIDVVPQAVRDGLVADDWEVESKTITITEFTITK